MWRKVEGLDNMLKFEMFNWAGDVVAFVNQHNIQQGDIQTIFYNERSNKYYLYYWS